MKATGSVAVIFFLLVAGGAAQGNTSSSDGLLPGVRNSMMTNADRPGFECLTKSRHNQLDDLQAIARAAGAQHGGLQDGNINIGDGAEWAGYCGRFFDKNGALGDWGKHALSEIDETRHAALLKDSDDITAICPRFSSMDTAEKKKFIVWTLSAGAMAESTCREKHTSPGPRGTALGLYQLHQGKEARYPNWGGGGKCRNGDGSNAKNSISCALYMLNDYKTKSGTLFTTRGKTYWAIFRADPAAREKVAPLNTCARMRMFKGCGNNATGLAEGHKECQQIFDRIKGGGSANLAQK